MPSGVYTRKPGWVSSTSFKKGHKESLETKRKRIKALIGVKKPSLIGNKNSKGHVVSQNSIKAIGKYWRNNPRLKGEDNPSWKGGISPQFMRKNTIRPKPSKCEVCGQERKIVFDHCHKKNVFRGWLCYRCNIALGMVDDDIEVLIKLIKYLSQ